MENDIENASGLSLTREEILDLPEIKLFLEDLYQSKPGHFELLDCHFIPQSETFGYIKINYKDQKPQSDDYYLCQQIFTAEKKDANLIVEKQKHYLLYALLKGNHYNVDEYGNLVPLETSGTNEW